MKKNEIKILWGESSFKIGYFLFLNISFILFSQKIEEKIEDALEILLKENLSEEKIENENI